MAHAQHAPFHPIVKAAIPLCIVIPAFVWFQYVGYTQYASHHFFLADIGVMDRALANTLAGDFMRSPISDWSYFAVHFRPVLLLFIPAYALFNHILTFSLLLNLCLAGAAIPLYYFATAKTHNRWLSAIITAAYLANHFTLSLHLALHPESLLMPGFFVMFLAIQRRKTLMYWAGVIWCLSIKEDIALFVAFYGVYLALIARDRHTTRRQGFLTIAVAGAWLIIAVVVMSILKPDEGVYKGGVAFLERYRSMGDSWLDIVVYAVTHPWNIIYRIFSRRALYILIASAGFLPLLHPRSLSLLIPPALIFLISDFKPMNRLLYYYSYPFLPFLFLSTVEGTGWLLSKVTNKNIRYIPAFILIVVSIVSFLSSTRMEQMKSRPFPITAHHRALQPLIREHIPPPATIVAQYEIFCQIPHTYKVFPLWLENMKHADYIIIDTTRPSPDLTPEDREQIMEIVSNKPFLSAVEHDGYKIYKREKE